MDILARIYPEFEIDHFTNIDGTVAFYNKVKALYPADPGPRVLDYGAGRAAWFTEDASKTRRELRDLRNRAVEVVAADIDDAVLQNQCSHKQVVFSPDKPLPFPDDYFDIVVADHVFEHITDPAFAAAQMLRVVKPGGWICARTPNKHSYIALMTRLVPNRLHTGLLKHAQPGRKEADIFPTTHALSSPAALRKHFAACNKLIVTWMFSEPRYHFNKPWLCRLMLLLHWLLPRSLAPSLMAYIRK